jgi:hypothetical protein
MPDVAELLRAGAQLSPVGRSYIPLPSALFTLVRGREILRTSLPQRRSVPVRALG